MPSLNLEPPGGTTLLKLSDLNPELEPFTGSETFDFVTGKYDYANVENKEIQTSFRDAAEIAATFEQTREALDLFERKGRKIENTKELTYYILMANLAGRLPGLMEKAEKVESALASHDFGKESAIESTNVTLGSQRATKQLASVLESDRDVDDVLEDYKALKQEIEAFEEAEMG